MVLFFFIRIISRSLAYNAGEMNRNSRYRMYEEASNTPT